MRPATACAIVLLSAVCLLHVLRVAYGVPVIAGTVVIPLWASGVAAVVAGGLAVWLWRDARASQAP